MSGMRRRTIRLRLFAVAFFFAWVLFALYPRPSDLVKSVYRVFSPPVDGGYAVSFAHLFADMDEPVDIETQVESVFAYQYDWVTYDLPWYYPTVEEAFDRMAGDCKTQLVVLASVLESRGIPYTIRVSPTHVWVDYEGKPQSRVESAELAIFTSPAGNQGESTVTSEGPLSRPEHFDMARSFEVFWVAFWDYMPTDRKISLAVGLFISVLLFAFSGIGLSPVIDVSLLPDRRPAADLQ
ncbi:MAG: hypothetical protein ACLFM0_07030 [Spirochaetales bacterium]